MYGKKNTIIEKLSERYYFLFVDTYKGDGRETLDEGPTEISDITTRGELRSVP